MKKLLTLAALIGATSFASAQGTFNWANTASTLVSAGGTATPVVGTSQFIFAVFFAPSSTVGGVGQTGPLFTAPAFQAVGNYNTNTTAAGRLASKTALADLSNTYAAGSTVDFIIRGWSANAGTSWAAALAFWNNGSPSADMYIGQSVIGNDFVLGGGAIPNAGIVGAGPNQVGGFNMALVTGNVVPEPTSMALAGLGAASLLIFRRRK